MKLITLDRIILFIVSMVLLYVAVTMHKIECLVVGIITCSYLIFLIINHATKITKEQNKIK